MSVNVMRLLICSILFSASLFSFTFTPAIGQEANQTAAPDGRGAGFIIGNAGQVLTTARAVDGCDDVQAKMHGKTATALVVARDAVNDLALLKLDGPVPNGSAIRTTAPQMGEQIVTLAFVTPGWAASTARRGEANSTEGAVTALTGSTSSSTNDTRLLQISEPVRQNDSGGPLLDRSGHVIGVVSWRRGAPESDRGLAIKAAIVQAFLDAHGISYRTSGPPSPLEAADIAGEAKGYTFTIECIKRPRFVSETPPQAIKRESAAVNTPTHDKQAGQRAVLYEEDNNNPSGFSYAGTTVWRTEQVASADGGKPDIVVHADVDIPHKLSMRWSLQRNADKQLPASHFIEVAFAFPPDSDRNAVSKVPGVMVKAGETSRGTALNGVSVQVSGNFFLLGLSSAEADMQRNVQLLQERSWVDIPIVYGDGKRALLAFEKGPGGARAFADAFAAWQDAGGTANASPKEESQPEQRDTSAP